MKKFVLIAGGGYFGTIAAKFFRGRKDVKVLLTDINASCPASEYIDFRAASLDELDFSKGTNMLVADAVEVFVDLLGRGMVPELVVPAIPGHFAGKALKRYLERNGFTVRPSKNLLEHVRRKLPENLAIHMDENDAVIVCSYMPFDKRCKVPCSQPRICPVTKRRKERAMYDLLSDAASGAGVNRILRSSLVTENVGAFEGEKLLEAIDECVKRGSCTVAIGTACRCHGIVNLFEVS